MGKQGRKEQEQVLRLSIVGSKTRAGIKTQRLVRDVTETRKVASPDRQHVHKVTSKVKGSLAIPNQIMTCFCGSPTTMMAKTQKSEKHERCTEHGRTEEVPLGCCLKQTKESVKES